MDFFIVQQPLPQTSFDSSSQRNLLLSESLATWNKVWFDSFKRLVIIANLSLILLTAAAGLLVSVEARVGRPRGVGSAGAAGVDRGSS